MQRVRGGVNALQRDLGENLVLDVRFGLALHVDSVKDSRVLLGLGVNEVVVRDVRDLSCGHVDSANAETYESVLRACVRACLTGRHGYGAGGWVSGRGWVRGCDGGSAMVGWVGAIV